MAKHLPLVSICSVMMFIALFTTALLFAQDQTDNFDATINIPIDLLNSLAVDEVGILTVYIDCNAPSCAAINLNITYDPNNLRVEALDLSDQILTHLNPIYILRKEIDTANGQVLLTYVTEDVGAPPIHGDFELMRLTIRRLSENIPQLDVQRFDVITMEGMYVSTTRDMPSTGNAELIPTQIQNINPTVTLEISVIGLGVDNPITHSKASVKIIPDAQNLNLKHIEITVPVNFKEILLIDQKGYIGCSFTLDKPPQYPITLYPGDIDDNGMINDVDLNMWEVLSKETESQWVTDLNFDGKLDIRDIVIISKNIGLTQGVCL